MAGYTDHVDVVVRWGQCMKLREAIEVVNSTKRGPRDAPLVVLAKCSECSEEFAMLPQDFSRAEVQGLPKHCRPCALKKRRESRRK